MPRVHVLDEALANRIAAGEVVERPASVVKELVENALDAGARRVEVELEEGGRRLIRVRDDGCGLSAEDALLAVQRFATSKIRSPEDLDAILTMGFRGEALPSIAAVSHFRIQSREPDSAEGVEVSVGGGGEPQTRPVGCPPGTLVEVRELFFNTPARAKFLSTTGRERGHCADWVARLALARPDVAFKLVHDGDTLLGTSGAGDLRSVLAAIHGSTTAREFVEVRAEAAGLVVAGLISGPKILRATREHQLFFVNGRFVRSRQMGHALNEAYGLLLPAGRNPMCALHLTVDPLSVDPNVHPTKIEVRFRRPGEVHELVQAAAEEALAEAGYRSLSQRPRHVPRSADEGPGISPLPGHGPGAGRFVGPAGRVAPPDALALGQVRRLQVNPFEDRVDARDDGLEVHDEPTLALPARGRSEATAPDEATLPVEASGERLRVLGQLAGRYLVVGWSQGLLLVDQHRAAERVYLERLGQGAEARQLLVVPEALKLTAGEAAATREGLELLSALGYELEEFGTDTFLVRSVPASVAQLQPVEALRAAIGELAESGRATSVERRAELARATVACHAATKAGQRLNPAEMQQLVDDLMASQSPAVCPHGDPVIVSFPLERLDRAFHRA